MAFKSTQFADLPVTKDVSWDPNEQGRAALQNEVLGDPPDWERFRKAHLAYDSENSEILDGYKLMVARMVDGKLTVVFSQLASRLAILNGARGGVDLPSDVKEAAFKHGLKYYDKLDIPKEEQPKFTGKMSAKYTATLTAQKITLEDNNFPKWQQIALEGKYPGYRRGMMPFELTRQNFEEIVVNFRNHPSYKKGKNGFGAERIVPWDFEHASEVHPADGLVPVTGAPAQGWVLDLDIRQGNSGAELWALTEFLDTAREYILSGQYQWPSVSIVFDAVDPKTAQNIGAILTSVALTNQPFIQGMNKLVANGRAEQWCYDSASDASGALSMFKQLLGLPELADPSTVVAELTKLHQWISTGTTPAGISVNDISSCMRKILNLPALTTELDTVSESLRVMNRLIEEKAIEIGATPAPVGQSAPMEGEQQSAGGIMEMEQFLKALSERLEVRPNETDVMNAVQEAVELRAKAQALLSADKDSNKVILTAAQDLVSSAEKLDALTKALGVENAESAVLKIDALNQASEELAKFKDDQEEAKIQEEVSEVMASRKMDEKLKDALLLLRRHSPEKFAADFPKLTKQQVNLTQNVATKNGDQISVNSQKSTKDNVINLSHYKGRNQFEQVIAYLKDNDEKFAKLSWEEQCQQASKFRKQMNGQ